MTIREIAIDTNVILSGLRSQLGASFVLLSNIGVSPRIKVHLSVPLTLEYEEVLKRESRVLGLTHKDIEGLIDYICSVAGLHDVYYLWRPFLPDTDDDMLLEVALGGWMRYDCDAQYSPLRGNRRAWIAGRYTRGVFERDRIIAMSAMSVRLPDSLHKKARELARQEGVSVNQLVATALAEKISALMTVEHLNERGAQGQRAKFEAVLAKVRDNLPAPEDELPKPTK